MATIGCSAPIFLSILSYAIAVGGLIQVILTFIVYASGMGLPLIVITILMVEAKNLMLNKIMKMTQQLHKISGIALIFIGLYLTYFYFASRVF
jgi:cytochrome c biogenesis protein CcdA